MSQMTDEQVDKLVDALFENVPKEKGGLAWDRAIYRAAYAHGRKDGMREAAKMLREDAKGYEDQHSGPAAYCRANADYILRASEKQA